MVESIWRAGVAAVDSRQLVQKALQLAPESLLVGGLTIPRSELRRVEIVGAGKAGAGMAWGAEEALASLPDVQGWVNVPADCVKALPRLHLHAARPAGRNEPTPDGVAGSEEILRRVSSLGPGDLCLVLISGGGSALLPAPVEGVPLSDKLAVIRMMSLAGATIHEMNQVRRALSRIKGGGLARTCRAEWLVTLVISDVIGDPLDTIASGPTIQTPRNPAEALTTLERFMPPANIPASIRHSLTLPFRAFASKPGDDSSFPSTVQIIGNNFTAVDAAATAARSLDLDVVVLGADQAGVAAEVGRELARECLRRQNGLSRPLCMISGGEPVVHVTPAPGPQKGGRNQELALAALDELAQSPHKGIGITILSGGTDGEDGPTDAAGAFAELAVLQHAAHEGLTIAPFLATHNSYEFFRRTQGLLKTGPTHTNVMDLRVALIQPL